MLDREKYLKCFGDLWNSLPTGFPEFQMEYSADEKLCRENTTDQFHAQFKKYITRSSVGMNGNNSHQLLDKLQNYLTDTYDFRESTLRPLFNKQFFNISKQFFGEAQAFDAGLKPAEIYQAMRNVWIINSIQLMFDRRTELTPSVFAYSLLYPYSDNAIDGSEMTSADKLAFCSRFEKRLLGSEVSFECQREEKIGTLVGMIEQQFPRDAYPEVYDSLLAIHEAQTRSIFLQKNGTPLLKDVFNIGFDKGGTSVLADGYLVAGKLSEEEKRFLYGYGIWLQLADDIQDIEEDLGDGVHTLITNALENDNLPVTVNKSIHFGRCLMAEMGKLISPKFGELKNLMQQSVETMILQSAGINNHYFPADYIDRIERHSPLGFKYLRDKKKNGLLKRKDILTRILSSG